MPSVKNILSPITLLAHGRSGTSLLLNIFDNHPEIFSVGETANLVYGFRDTLLRTIPVTNVSANSRFENSSDKIISDMVREIFLSMFPSSEKYWFQKPIGIPRAIQLEFNNNQWEEANHLYWKIMKEVFPEAKFFTIIRNPFDVLLSAKSFWGWPETGIWRSMGWVSSMIIAVDSGVDYAIHYDELVSNREKVIGELFKYLGIPVHDRVFKGFEKIRARDPQRKINNGDFSRRNEWKSLDFNLAIPNFVDPIIALHKKFSFSVNWAELLSNGSTGSNKLIANNTGQLEKLKAENKYLKEKIQQLHVNYSNRSR